MIVQLLLTGDELMSGDTIDTNSSYISKILKEVGIEVNRKVTVSDRLTSLVTEIEHISKDSDILIINGGLGPTTDDLTAQALAIACQVPLAEHPHALTHLEHWCKERGFVLNTPNRKQALLPQDCTIIANDIGSAVGFSCRLNNCEIYCTPGVPSELKLMLNKYMLADITAKMPTEHLCKTQKLFVFGLGESTVQKLINEQFPDWPSSIVIGYRADMPILEVKITTPANLDLDFISAWFNKLKSALGFHIYSDQEPSLAKVLVQQLTALNKTLTTAESCTGGLIAANLTQNSGASKVFHAGFVTYSNDIKHSLLSVDTNTLECEGAVSENVVIQMAQGALQKSGSDYAIAVSGIAGPNGGSETKPVGTVWIAWGNQTNLKSVCLLIPAGRLYFQQYVSAVSIDLMRRFILNCDDEPHYITTRRVNA